MIKPSHFLRPIVFSTVIAVSLGITGLAQPAAASLYRSSSFEWTYTTYINKALTAANAGECKSATTLVAKAAQAQYNDMTRYRQWCGSILSRSLYGESDSDETCDISTASSESLAAVTDAENDVIEICKTMDEESDLTTTTEATTAGALATQAAAAAKAGNCDEAVTLLAKAKTAMSDASGNYVKGTSENYIAAQSTVREYCATELMSAAHNDTEANLDAVGVPAAIQAINYAKKGDCTTAASYLETATSDTTLYKNGKALTEQGMIVTIAVNTVAQYCTTTTE